MVQHCDVFHGNGSMTSIAWNGGPIFRNGAVGTGQACCCETCAPCCVGGTRISGPDYDTQAECEAQGGVWAPCADNVSCEGRWGLGTGDPDCGDTQCCTCGKCTPGHWGRDAGDCVCTPGPIPDGVDPAYIDPDAGSFDINQYGQYFFTTRTICCDVTGPTALGECIEVPP